VEGIGNRLKRLRLKCGLSQKEIAIRIGISGSTYRDWEYGNQIMGEPYSRLAEVFGVTLTEILSGDPSKDSGLLKVADELEIIVKSIRKIASTL
jgi:transcriptional regulator with XRE-family HTH domain